MDHATGAVLAQRQVDGAPEEVTAFRPLLARLELTSVVVTADALHTKREAAEFLVTGKHAHYLFVVKGNLPNLHAQLRALPWPDIPTLDRIRGRAHGRAENRTLKVAAVPGLDFPARHPGAADHPSGPRPAHPTPADRHGLRDHQPGRRPGR